MVKSNEKITLDDDETMLLLVVKNYKHKDVPLDGCLPGSVSYIQAVCNHRCGMSPNHHADVFTIYMELCEKICNRHQFAHLLRRVYQELTWPAWLKAHDRAFDVKTLLERIFGMLQSRPTSDLTLDESLVERVQP